MRTAYLGTSEFAAAVLRRLAGSRHRPRLVVTPPDRPRGRGRRSGSPPAALVARELEIDLLQAENVNDGAALERIRAAGPEALAVCAFGQLIREPLLSELPLLNVHPSLLPRWRGAAPIERAIMAGDARTGVSIMRLTAGLDSGPVAMREEVDDRLRGRLRDRLRAAQRARRRAAGPGPRPPGGGDARVRRAGRRAGDLRREDRPRGAPPRSRASRRGAGPQGARPDPARRRLPRARRGQPARRAARAARSTSACAQARSGPSGGRCCSAAAGGRCGWRSCSRRAGSRWPPTPTCAAIPCPPCERRGDFAGPAARLRDDPRDLRAGCPHRARLPRGGRPARPRGPRPRPGAAPRLRRGPAARHDRRGDRATGGPLAALARPARAGGAAARPLRAALLRRDPRPRRGRPGGRAGQGGRRRPCRRPRQRGAPPRHPRARRADDRAARRRLDPRARRRRPLGAALAGADVVGRAGSRRRRARCSPPATSRPRWRSASTRAAATERRCWPGSREAGVEARPADGAWPLALAEEIVDRRQDGDGRSPTWSRRAS